METEVLTRTDAMVDRLIGDEVIGQLELRGKSEPTDVRVLRIAG